MKLRESAGLIGLGVLAVAAAVLVALAFEHVRPSTSSLAATPAPPQSSASAPGPSESPQDVEPTPEPATPTPDSRSAEPKPEPEAGSLEEIQALLAGDGEVVVSVLGDGSGNSKDEWVSFWADDLAEGHAVSYRAWNSNTGDYGDAERLSQIGTAIEIYNGSRAGETAIEAGASLGDLQPESPDLVVLNLGHSESASEMTEGLDGLWSTISADHEDARGLVILQNPASGDVAEEQDTRIDLLRSWASDNQLPTLDVHRAFNEAPDPLSTYLFDGSYPNESGSRLWADTVTAALSS